MSPTPNRVTQKDQLVRVAPQKENGERPVQVKLAMEKISGPKPDKGNDQFFADYSNTTGAKMRAQRA